MFQQDYGASIAIDRMLDQIGNAVPPLMAKVLPTKSSNGPGTSLTGLPIALGRSPGKGQIRP